MIFILIGVVLISWLAVKFFFGRNSGKDLNENDGYLEGWYGNEDPPDKGSEDTLVRSFTIDVPDEVLKDLNLRLERARFEEPVKDSKFLYGFNPNYLRKIAEYWRTHYNWRNVEEKLNKYPHFKTRIEGLDIHFMHIKPVLPEESKIKVIPLLIIHGWPGSFVEFMKVIPLLTTPRPNCSFVFEVVCPSIPGFGFSESPHRKGFNARAAARIFVTLMERIGCRKFYVQGGDWGSYIASLIARYYSPRVIGLHVNMYFFLLQGWERVKFFLVLLFPFLVSRAEYMMLFPLKKKLSMILQESGYFHMQATKPDTLGCAMSDSPVGTAAYLLEKFSGATSLTFVKLPDGGLTEKFTLDELLTNVMIYWINNNFTAAARFYKENLKDAFRQIHEKVPVTVPSGVALFPNEVLMMPRMLMSQQMKDIVSYTVMPKGGHFAALEEPQLFSDDIWKFVDLVEKKLK